jgi:hypothetical protein
VKIEVCGLMLMVVFCKVGGDGGGVVMETRMKVILC